MNTDYELAESNYPEKSKKSGKQLIMNRVLVFIIDRTIAALIIIAGIPIVIAGESYEISGLELATKIIFFFLLALAVVYSYARDLIGGRSIGRRMFSQQVVDIDTGQPISGWKSLLREIPIHFAPLLAIEFVAMINNPDHRRLGDHWAKSIVISTKNRELI